ncbi:hypothetical protein Q3V30_21830 (plasmid) [Erwinia pyri]|uniref:Uncharacterized protein n=1 Tax=Erwinia pyri TaxID=3062598 RepID=A0AA50DPN8_9GAMM|nr:hypothetical protein [Erwinia sp. DE2]WLS81107.1 hypothetical protein Q3V30_21830 [Erwinia sp. DE2]
MKKNRFQAENNAEYGLTPCAQNQPYWVMASSGQHGGNSDMRKERKFTIAPTVDEGINNIAMYLSSESRPFFPYSLCGISEHSL